MTTRRKARETQPKPLGLPYETTLVEPSLAEDMVNLAHLYAQVQKCSTTNHVRQMKLHLSRLIGYAELIYGRCDGAYAPTEPKKRSVD